MPKTPEPFFTFQPSRALNSPVVVSVPHSGLRIPESRHALMVLSETLFTRDVDYEIHRMWQDACAELDVSFVKSEVHRYAIDLNRRADQVDSWAVQGPRFAKSPGAPRNPKGLIWTESTRGEPLAPAGRPFVPISEETLDGLVRDVWAPYYACIERELERARKKFGFAILLDGHSMPSRGTAFHADPGGARADIVPGDFKGQACDARLTQAAVETARAQGFSVSVNDPYGGGNITQHFGQPAQGWHALQIEVNRGLYLQDEEAPHRGLREANLERLKDLAREVLRRAGTLRLG